MLRVACVQFTAGPDIAPNLKEVESYIRKAAAQGAKFIATPENTCHMRFPQSDKLNTSPAEADHPALPLFAALARELNVWLLLGSVAVKLSADKLANRSYLFNDQGQRVASYDKMHLFDVDLAGGESYRESAVVRGGEKATLADTPWGKLGMAICYDLRFPALFRTLAQAGASIITLPSAFTVPTGQAHWEVLIRARAIENGAFVIAPAQCGTHQGGRQTYGHSMIVGPWGDIVAKSANEPGLLVADIDLQAVEKARSAIPSLKHDRKITL